MGGAPTLKKRSCKLSVDFVSPLTGNRNLGLFSRQYCNAFSEWNLGQVLIRSQSERSAGKKYVDEVRNYLPD